MISILSSLLTSVPGSTGEARVIPGFNGGTSQANQDVAAIGPLNPNSAVSLDAFCSSFKWLLTMKRTDKSPAKRIIAMEGQALAPSNHANGSPSPEGF